MSRLARLRRLGREEFSWRLAAAGRIHRDGIKTLVSAPRWDRNALADVLARPLSNVLLRTAIEERDWRAAHAALHRAFTTRPSRFVLDPATAGPFRAALLARWPDAAQAAAAHANPLLRGHFNVLGYRDVSYGYGTRLIDWHYDPVHGRKAPMQFWANVPYLDPVCGDHKIIWELNRHQHWLGLGRALWLTREPKYGGAISDQLESWLEANPPLMGINWASMLELALRSLSWIWAMHFLLADEELQPAGEARPWLVDLLIGLDRQLTHVEQNLSRYFSPNTHLTGEALALYVAGRALPELARAGRWEATGRDVLLREIDTQILPDGGHAERSLHYHRYTLDFYLMALLIARRSGDEAGIAAFTDAVTRTARFARALADDHGRFATIGDDDGGMLWPMAGRKPHDVRDSLALAALVLDDATLAPWPLPEEACWLWGAVPDDRQPLLRRSTHQAQSVAFPDTGYAVIRDGDGSHLIFDAGAHGYLNGGHAHADALAFTLTVSGVPLFIDPGTGTYSMNAQLRDYFRSGASHNTMMVDGASPSEPAGPFHWRRRTDAHLAVWRANNAVAWAEGNHAGFPGLSHRRSLVHAAGGGWLVLDEVLGRGPHAVDLHWHFNPQWHVTCESKGRLMAVHDQTGSLLWLTHDEGGLSLVRGDDQSAFGWYAPEYGAYVPIWSARFSHSIVAPATLVTWVGRAERYGFAPVVERLQVEHEPGAPAHAVRVSYSDITETTLLRPGDRPERTGRGCNTPDFHTDARMLHVTRRGNELRSVALADGAHALALNDGLFTVACDHAVTDVAVTADGDAIEVIASTPLPRLQIQGAAAARARLVRLNGRERPLVREGRIDTIVISSVDWAEHRPDTRTTCVA